MADDRTNNIDTPTLFDDVLKTSKSASQFGPVRVYRVPEKPADSFGRNGDLCIIDNTAVSSIEIAIEQCPTDVGFCQKIYAQVPGSPNRASSTAIGADLVGNDSFTINGTAIVLPAGSVFVADAVDAINAAEIPGMNVIGLTTSAPGTVISPAVLPGDQLIINGVTVTFSVNGGVEYIASAIDAAAIPFINISTLGNKITVTHTRGGTITLGGTNLLQIMGTPTISGGTMSLTNEDGTTVTSADVVGTPLATMGFPLVIPNSALVCGGTWQCFDTNGIEIKDHGTSLGTFETIDFTGTGVTITDGGGGEAIVTVTGGADQNLVDTFTGNIGSFTVGTPTDTLNIIGTGLISTNVVGNTLTISSSGAGTQPVWLNIQDDVAATISAASATDTLIVAGGTGISTAVAGSTVTVTNTAPSPTGMTVTVINGQPMLTLVDTTRTNKILSVTEQGLAFSENRLNNLDWLDIGGAVDAKSGYIMDFDGTVVFATGHCEDTKTFSKIIHLFINDVFAVSLGTLSGGADATFINTTIDLNFSQGDRITLQAVNGIDGFIEDTVVKVSVKWRG